MAETNDDPFAEYEDLDDDVGLEEDDKVHGKTDQLEWFRGDKGRSYRAALVYFHPIEASALKRARKLAKDKGETISREQGIAIIRKAIAARAEQLGKQPDQLTDIEKLDLDHVRFKKIWAHYKEGFGFACSRMGLDGPEADKVWEMLGDRKKYFTTVLLLYPCKSDGSFDKSRFSEWHVVPWRFSTGIYNQFHDSVDSLRANELTIADQDLVLTCTNPDFQQFKIKTVGKALWRRDEKFKQMVLESAHRLYEKLVPFREMSTEDLKIKLGLATAATAGDDVSEIDFEGMLGDDSPLGNA